MRPPKEEVIRKLVGEWLEKADADLEAAEALLFLERPLLHPSCFHSQQATEKYLKAFLTSRQVESPKTHNIRELLNLVKTVDEGLPDALQSAVALTPYGVDLRYPGSGPEPSPDEARRAVELARTVRDRVMKWLKSFRSTGLK